MSYTTPKPIITGPIDRYLRNEFAKIRAREEELKRLEQVHRHGRDVQEFFFHTGFRLPDFPATENQTSSLMAVTSDLLQVGSSLYTLETAYDPDAGSEAFRLSDEKNTLDVILFVNKGGEYEVTDKNRPVKKCFGVVEALRDMAIRMSIHPELYETVRTVWRQCYRTKDHLPPLVPNGQTTTRRVPGYAGPKTYSVEPSYAFSK